MLTMKSLKSIFVFFIFIPSMINGQMWGSLKYSISKKLENINNDNNDNNENNNNTKTDIKIINLSYYFNETNLLLRDISTESWSNLNDIFPNTIRDFQKAIKNSDNKKNNEICLQILKKQIISAVFSSIEKNHQCLNNQLQNYYEFIRSEILSNHNVILNFPSCSKKDETPQKILNCIDNEVTKKNKKNSDKIYLDLLKTMNEKNTTIIKQLNDCINNNVTKHLDKIVSNTTNNFYSCIKMMENSGKKMNTDEKINYTYARDNSSSQNKISLTLYNNQMNIFKENITKQNIHLSLIELETRSYQDDVVWSIEDGTNKSVDCCLDFPRQKIITAGDVANFKTNQCFQSVSSKYNQSIISYIKAIQSKHSIFKNCYKINKSTELTLKCIDNLALNDKSNDAKSSYEILILFLQGKFNYAIMAMTNCLQRVKIHFKSSISLAQINFNECIVNNKDHNCHVIQDNVDDLTNW